MKSVQENSKQKNNSNNSTNEKYKYKNFNNLINTFYNEEIEGVNFEKKIILPEKDKIKIEIEIEYDKFINELKLEVKIGNKRMYKIKNLLEFYKSMSEKMFFKYGEKLEFVHTRENFEESSQDILDFILKYAEIMKLTNSNDKYNYSTPINKSIIILGENIIDEAFNILKKNKVSFNFENKSTQLNFIETNPTIEFDIEKINEEELKLKPNINVFALALFKGRNYDYLLYENKLYKCDKEYSKTTLKIIKAFRENYSSEMLFKKESLREFYSIIEPKINGNVKIYGMTEEEVEKYKPEKLAVKVYLDFDKYNYLTADVKFCYQDEEFNPLEENIKIKSKRNELEESRALNIFQESGFMFDTKNVRFIIPNDEKIYNFLYNDINLYMKEFEVLVTENFKTKEIKEPRIKTIGIKVENNLLNIDLSKLNISSQEIQGVMDKYKLRKKFYRLKDGSFLNLQNNKDIEFLDNLSCGMDIDYKEIEKDEIKLPINRTLYLNELLKKFDKAKLNENQEYKQFINNLEKNNDNSEFKIPNSMADILRDYQKNGINWLKTIEKYKLGGILADDMGLGKTIQILTIILSYIEEDNKNKKASIVISPSSLALNWLQEVKKFTPRIKAVVVSGSAEERSKMIQEIEKYDLIITSYDLLKRDIEQYKEKKYNFKYIIADEAQYLKNSQTQNAKSIKSLKGETKYALTGTPIENSLAELWSIFDYIMPGFLFEYKKFKKLYEVPIVRDKDVTAMNKLKMLIEPFILRRNKKEVLTELPDKTITVLNNSMEKEQETIYMSYLVSARQEIANEIDINGFEKSQIKILAALTRLRQICCHPSLFISDYKGESSKLTQCIEIIEDAISAGHKILLFSGYTSMFEIIQKELDKRNIKFLKLTGGTKVSDRISLVDKFNSNEDIKIFLISLKAGGTGLNLTGADMVIHYDPWWNVSAENQATDRAYRIGQKNNVQVYKLITNNSIEEKIYELQQKKSELIDNVLSTNTSFISKFSKEEIMKLFEI